MKKKKNKLKAAIAIGSIFIGMNMANAVMQCQCTKGDMTVSTKGDGDIVMSCSGDGTVSCSFP
jgi:hypothetical protein